MPLKRIYHNDLLKLCWKRLKMRLFSLTLALACFVISGAQSQENDLVRLPYNNPLLVVDLGVGLWAEPLPMDFDQDGDRDQQKTG